MSTSPSWQRWVTRAFPRAFTRRLGGLYQRHTKGHRLDLQGLEEEAKRLQQAYRAMATDAPAQVHLLMTAYVLAGYRVMRAEGMAAETVRDLLQEAFTGMGGRWIRLFSWLRLRFARDPLTALRRTAQRRALSDYGSTFRFSEKDIARGFVLQVHRCFYYDFFRRNGHPELTTIFCAWDRNWGDAIEPKRLGVRFERPATLAEGHAACEFVFRRETVV